MPSKYYLSTAIDYANGEPHLGHTFEKVLADAQARYRRLIGTDTHFQMGMDEHGQKVAQTADAQGIDPQAFTDQMAAKYEAVWRAMDLSHDAFVRTTDPSHKKGVQEIFRRCHEKGDIFKARYTGLYCVGCEAFYLEKDLVNGNCPVHGTPPKQTDEENYFFALSKYAEPLLKHIAANPDFITPEIRRNEVVSVIKGGLEDVSVSRANVKWGIPLPMDPEHTIYVWFDALINYATGVGFGDSSPAAQAMWKKWWPADAHVIGKDITRFHCIIWPSMLMSAGIPLYKSVYAHGWIQSPDGAKLSKTAGNVVDPIVVGEKLREATENALREEIQHEPLRFFLLREVGVGRDGEFSWDLFVERYNSELANELGNLANRALSMTQRYFGGAVEGCGPEEPLDRQLGDLATEVIAAYKDAFPRWQFSEGLRETWRLVKRANQYVAETESWVLAKDPARKDRLARVLCTLLESLRVTAALLAPAMPRTARILGEDLGLDWPAADALRDLTWNREPQGGRFSVRAPVVLFPRVQAPKPAKA